MLLTSKNYLCNKLVEDKIEIWKKNDFFILNDENKITNNDKLNQASLDNFHEKDITEFLLQIFSILIKDSELIQKICSYPELVNFVYN